jgi:indolepyruvate ferredoxin oxidoreductase
MADTANSGVTVARINPAESVPYRQLLEKTLLRAGVKVVIADKECGITFHRRVARDERREVHEKGYVARKRYINITPEVCENCRECTRATGCPGLTLEQTAYGPKVQTDLSWCVSDGACTRFLIAVGQGGQRVKSCPAFEEVTVLRTQRPESPFDRLDFSGLPSPPVVTLDRTWHGYLAGVGGMGIGTATAVLVLAGHREGHRVLFCDKKGLAIRNGGVYSMVSYLPKDAPFCSNLIPYGKADLLLGIDLLEAARALDASTNQRVGSPERTVAVINTHETPTIHVLIGKDEFHSEQLEAALKRMTRAQAYFGCDISELAEKFFGTQLYANMMLLGTAFQRGLLPVSLQNLESSIKAGLGSAAPDNLRAFNVGRLLVQDAAAVRRAVGLAAPPATFEATVADKADLLARTRFRGGQLGGSYRLMLERASGQLQLRREALREFARRAYDLVQYDGLHYAQRYVEWVKEIHAWDRPDKAYRATEAVIWNLHKVMAIKDEIYVAHLLTSEEKRRRDQGRYGVSPARGDRLEYRHFNRPQVRVWGRDFAWDMNTRDWMLNVVKRLRWVRRWLPDWHRAEKDFREWYIGLLPRFREASVEAQAYETFLRVLRLPESVTGYREIRYPKMTAAMAQAAEWLKEPAPKPAAAPPLVVA